MAELTIRPDEIRDALARFVQEYEPEGAAREEVGTVIECGDGIARVEGLPSAMANELLEFEDGIRGLALNLDVREIGVVILGEFSEIEEGQQVKRTGEILSVPVGDGFLGRVVDPLGEPLDGKGDIEADRAPRARDPGARRWSQRQPVKEPLQTGIKAIDAMTADRPRPAPADHRRPADRQDRRSPSTRSSTSRRTGSPATRSSRCAASTSRSARRARRSPQVRGRPGGGGRAGVHHDRRRPGLGPGRLQVHRALHRFGDRRSTGCTRASTR